MLMDDMRFMPISKTRLGALVPNLVFFVVPMVAAINSAFMVMK